MSAFLSPWLPVSYFLVFRHSFFPTCRYASLTGRAFVECDTQSLAFLGKEGSHREEKVKVLKEWLKRSHTFCPQLHGFYACALCICCLHPYLSGLVVVAWSSSAWQHLSSLTNGFADAAGPTKELTRVALVVTGRGTILRSRLPHAGLLSCTVRILRSLISSTSGKIPRALHPLPRKTKTTPRFE